MTILVYGLICILITIAMHGLPDKVRMQGFQRLAVRSQPLVTAIEEFAGHEGRLPTTLQELIPRYLTKIPDTGMPAFPEYRYSTETSRWDGNPWVLYVDCTAGGINFDMFLYFPKQNYPQEGYGGWLEKIENWAYVHE